MLFRTVVDTKIFSHHEIPLHLVDHFSMQTNDEAHADSRTLNLHGMPNSVKLDNLNHTRSVWNTRYLCVVESQCFAVELITSKYRLLMGSFEAKAIRTIARSLIRV